MRWHEIQQEGVDFFRHFTSSHDGIDLVRARAENRVETIKGLEFYKASPSNYIVFRDDVAVAEFSFSQIEHENALSVHCVVEPRFERQGIGTIIYDFAETVATRNGMDFLPSHSQTDKAKAFWKHRRPDLVMESRPTRWHEIQTPSINSLDDLKAFAASLGVELEVEMRGDDDIMLQWIKRSPRRAGSGSRVMQALTDYADRTECSISLGITDTRGRSNLISYYESYGFEVDSLSYSEDDEDGEPMMTYYPKSPD